MCAARVNVEHMSKMIQVRNVPDRLHRTLKARAAAEGLSLSDYIKRELETGVEQPTFEEVHARVRARRARRRGKGPSREEIVAVIREVRDS